MRAALAICMVFVGCCSNVVFLELLASEIPSSANIITFSQFLFISLEGLIFTSKFGRVSPNIPLKDYLLMTFMYLVTVAFHNIMLLYQVPIPIVVVLKSLPALMSGLGLGLFHTLVSVSIRYYVLMVAMFFVVQVVNNQALNFNISMPLHMIFRAGSLVANLILGIILMKKRYKFSKYVSVALISIGIAMCTISSANQVESHPNHTGDTGYDLLMWGIGIIMLSFALFVSAWMGIFQEQTYKKFGKHPSEALFYNHFLPLPIFLLLAPDIYKHIFIFNKSAPMVIPVLGITAPKMWVYLAGNILTQYVCIRAVFVLTTECASLTVTLVVTLRKFTSLLFSIIYFKNPFTLYHWLGTACVFVGTLLFTEVTSMFMKSREKEKGQ